MYLFEMWNICSEEILRNVWIERSLWNKVHTLVSPQDLFLFAKTFFCLCSHFPRPVELIGNHTIFSVFLIQMFSPADTPSHNDHSTTTIITQCENG